MSTIKPLVSSRRRDSSSSTVKALLSNRQQAKKNAARTRITATLWIHDDKTSTEDVLIKESLLEASVIREGDLVDISVVRVGQADYSKPARAGESRQQHDGNPSAHELTPRVLCIARTQQADAKQKQSSFDISLHSRLAVSSGFHSRDEVEIRAANIQDHTASHVELSFRDVYLARSDMWRMVGQELANKFVHVGQRITFLGSVRVTVKAIHVRGHRVAAAYFSGTTVPVFRSEAARYVIFIQMSREMWGFDSEGNGEILFNRVINGFLPDLFKRWTNLEVRHLVSIVLFGRQEYTQYDLEPTASQLRPPGNPLPKTKLHQDFYKVVVTDMASAQWTTILDELKKNFRVFLRDVSLYAPVESIKDSARLPKITGRLSTALKGNILEAINMASMQFSNDYVDRDLIRTNISVVVVTAGAGVFEVDKDLLNLTSENLTNNGIGIDIVCLAKMPLHSVPCFKYRTNTDHEKGREVETPATTSESPDYRNEISSGLSVPTSFRGSPLFQSITSESLALSRLSSTLPVEDIYEWSYGIPHWIDLSYWTPVGPKSHQMTVSTSDNKIALRQWKEPFVPRVRMYEVQMMGLTDLGMVDISIPWMSETQGCQPNRRRRRQASKQQWQGSRSLSHSPKLSRRSLRLESASFREQGLLAAGTRLLGETFNKMDAYDDTLFRIPCKKKRGPSATEDAGARKQKSEIVESPAPASSSSDAPEQTKRGSSPVAVPRPRVTTMDSLPGSDKASLSTLNKHRSPEATRTARNVSYALRGLAPPMRATASTEINIENAQAQMQKTLPLKSRPTIATSAQSIRSLSSQNTLPTSAVFAQSQFGSELSPVSSNAGSNRPSTPIKIGNTTAKNAKVLAVERAERTKLSEEKRSVLRDNTKHANVGDVTSSGESSDESSPTSDDISEILASSVPKSILPFIRNVNASNPLKGNAARESFFGRWQHLYPRKPRAATVKWRSLCTPASVPLTTEDFPSKDSLETDYSVREHTVSLSDAIDAVEQPESRDELLREMLSLRFAHGYQLVVGPRMNKFEGPGLHDASFFFNPDAKRHDGQYLFMSMGITIQKLSLLEKSRIRVTRYQRKPLQEQQALPKEVSFDSYVRTILAEQFKQQSMQVTGYAEEYPWEAADNYLAHPKKTPDKEIHTLRFWRARFVLLPVEPPANAHRPTPADSEENEEEIHLRGIRALTQAWQKLRYIPQEDRRPAQNRASVLKPKDRNPLSISIETLNPSELVATELERLLAAEEAGDVQTAQLLPEEEQFDRETAKLGKLASAIQGERGIEIKNRRWHLRLHYSCFHGEDFTNWLVQNVRDIDTREEAVEFGNQLMKEGLFEHVNSRHNFKDGNFFYSIKSEWRSSRSENRQSWFPASRRSDKSIPATPVVEHAMKESPSAAARARSASNLAYALTPASSEGYRSTPERKKLAVSLSKMIRLDVDVRKRSNRPEIINLHYDRLHNPENCYHLELSWLNVTSKLVDDAIVSWTTIAERYGLKLVEVPMVEASKVPLNEPFRSAYRIKLAVAPPPPQALQANANGNSFFTATSFAPHQPLKADEHFYQKELLRRFNFVLDLEGMDEFPENVEINYSWGKLNYSYTQFVHRSGVILAQITEDGSILLLANRLYNSRLASTKETTTKIETSRQLNAAAQALRPLAQPLPNSRDGQMQPSGILGINVQSPAMSSTSNPLGSPSPLLRPLPRPLVFPPTSAPNTTISSTLASAVNSTSSVPLAHPLTRLHPSITTAATPVVTPGPRPTSSHGPISTVFAASPSPRPQRSSDGPTEPIDLHTQHASADVFGPSRRGAPSTFITPEQIKDDLERFCTDPTSLQAFYDETRQALIAEAQATAAAASANLHPTQQGQQAPSLPGTPVSNPADKESTADKERRERDKKRGSIIATGSSLLRPVAETDFEVDGSEADAGMGSLSGIPEMRLPESVHGHGHGQGGGGGSKGWGLGLKRS